MTVGLENTAGGYLGQRVQETHPTVTLVRFAIGDLVFATPLANVAAVMAASSMMPVDEGDPHSTIIGRVRSLRSDVDVIDGARLVGPGDDVATPRVLVLRGGRPLGITVSQVLESHEATEEQVAQYNDFVSRRLTGSLASGLIWRDEENAELLLNVQETVRSRGLPRAPHDRNSADRTRLAARYRGLNPRQLLEIALIGSDERWAVPMNAIRHVADARRPLPLPGAPQDVLGLLSWQRRPIPVIDPSVRLDLENDGAALGRLIVIGPPDEPAEVADAAILVRDVRGLHTDLQLEDGIARSTFGDQMRVLDLVAVLEV